MEVDQHENHSSIHLFEMQTDSGEIVFNYRNRLDIFATFGVSSFMIETPQTSFSGTGPTQLQAVVRIETDTDFSWSVGSRGRIWSCRNFALAGEAQYFAGKSSISTIDNPFASEFVTYSKLANLKYQEWQFGLGASYQICLSQSIQALPYIGLTCSHAWVNMGRSVEPIDDDGTPFSFITLHNLSNQKVVGYAVGVTLAGSECFQFTLENRFASENAIYFNAEVKF
ncbi:MAG: hypothetical protein SP4CHLAM17_14640 [Chlamydiales bacterium]|nr:hypothetical protein [Chlamydiales bacterium]